MRSALLAADFVLVPAQPSPFDGWASGEMLKLIAEAKIFRPQIVSQLVLNRCGSRTVIARETAELLADHDPPALASTIGQRVGLAAAARSGRLDSEIDDESFAAREIAAQSEGWRDNRRTQMPPSPRAPAMRAPVDSPRN